jgi:hypothetical protein
MDREDELLDEEDEEELELHFFAEGDSPRRPWPDYISVSPEGERILLGSYDQAFMLDSSGHLRWTWRTPKHEQVSSLLTGPRADRSFVASEEGSLNILDGDGNLQQTHRCGEELYSVAASSDFEQYVCSHEGGLSFYRRDGGLIRRHPRKDLPFNGFLNCTVAMRRDGERVLAWRDREMLVFDGSGRLLTAIEFARRMGPPAFDSDGDILIAAGRLIRVRVNS